MGLTLLVATLAGATPLQLEEETPGAWAAAAPMAGFELGPCHVGPCARWVAGGVQLIHPDGSVERVEGTDPEQVLAVTQSRLTLGRAQAAAEPRPAAVRRHREPALRLSVESSASVATRRIVPVAVDTHFEVMPPRFEPTQGTPTSVWIATAAGVSSGALVAVQVGADRGRWWTGVGTRIDGAIAADFGVGHAVRTGPLRWRIGGWAGAEYWPADCIMCNVDITQSGSDQSTDISSVFRVEPGQVGWAPVGRAEVELGVGVGPNVTVAPRAALAVGVLAPRPELALAVRWAAQ